jgi:hypothetical protein
LVKITKFDDRVLDMLEGPVRCDFENVVGWFTFVKP